MSRAAGGFRVVGIWIHSARAVALLVLAAFLQLVTPPPAFAQLPAVGLSSVGGQAFASEDLLLYQPAAGELFGAAVVAGDVDFDGDDDLAIGQPGEDLGGDGRGGVTLVTGDPNGGLPLTSASFLPESPVFREPPRMGSRSGWRSRRATRRQVLGSWREAVSGLAAKVPGWSEHALDLYRLPHPLLGKLTVREMLLFTVYHNAHHLEQVASRR